MTSQEIIKYYKPNIIRFIILALKQKEEKAIDNLWNLGWFTPEEYDSYKDKELSYKQMMAIYEDRKQDWASDYIRRSYNEGYLDSETYNLYVEFYTEWTLGEITDNEMTQAMLLTLQIIKNNRLEEE